MGIPERWKRFAPLPEDLERRLDSLPPLFRSRGVKLAYLFGSLAAGGRGSDVDLGVLGGEPGFPLREALMEKLGTERLDLVDLATASPLLRFEIVRRGRLLYAVDEEVLNRFELDTLHLYRDTAPMRRRQRSYLRERMERWSCAEKPSKDD